MRLRTPRDDERAQIVALLTEAALPTADLYRSDVHFIIAVREDGTLAGTIGLQAFGDAGLVRSLAVRADARERGLGGRLVQALETQAAALGLRELVLLTLTAEAFFVRRGYRRIERVAAPPGAQATAEFRNLCPGSAACLLKRLDATPAVKRLLFVCVENANRSQMAEAFARLHGGDRVEALSAGSRPSGVINPKAVRFMAELGYDLSTHASKSLDRIEGEFDAVITMGCGDGCPWVPARRREDWSLPDPKHLDDDGYRGVRDEIARRVRELLADLG